MDYLMMGNVTITEVAVMDSYDRMWHLPKPFRHHNVLHALRGGGATPGEEGFMLSNGAFISRKVAFELAQANGQLKRNMNPGSYQGDELFSEDLW